VFGLYGWLLKPTSVLSANRPSNGLSLISLAHYLLSERWRQEYPLLYPESLLIDLASRFA
jgi:hypothetical protein